MGKKIERLKQEAEALKKTQQKYEQKVQEMLKNPKALEDGTPQQRKLGLLEVKRLEALAGRKEITKKLKALEIPKESPAPKPEETPKSKSIPYTITGRK